MTLSRSMLCAALLGVLAQAGAPALQALHAAGHDRSGITASGTERAYGAFRETSRFSGHHDHGDAAGIACEICKVHARLGWALASARDLPAEAAAYERAAHDPHAPPQHAAARSSARPRAPPGLSAQA